MIGPQPIGTIALEVARQYVGVAEAPPGSNMTRFGEWWGVNGVRWCAIFVSYCFSRGPGYFLCEDWIGRPGVRPGRGCSFVPTIAEWGKHRGFWLGPKETPAPGDLIIYDWTGDGAYDHIGLVDRIAPDGRIGTFEGNVHNAVASLLRHPSAGVGGFVRVTR